VLILMKKMAPKTTAEGARSTPLARSFQTSHCPQGGLDARAWGWPAFLLIDIAYTAASQGEGVKKRTSAA